jgi:hypothetical protein
MAQIALRVVLPRTDINSPSCSLEHGTTLDANAPNCLVSKASRHRFGQCDVAFEADLVRNGASSYAGTAVSVAPNPHESALTEIGLALDQPRRGFTHHDSARGRNGLHPLRRPN